MKFCDCHEYEMINGKLVCKRCKKPMRFQSKPQTSIARRHKMTEHKHFDKDSGEST